MWYEWLLMVLAGLLGIGLAIFLALLSWKFMCFLADRAFFVLFGAS